METQAKEQLHYRDFSEGKKDYTAPQCCLKHNELNSFYPLKSEALPSN
jgi:hypothetical protein